MSFKDVSILALMAISFRGAIQFWHIFCRGHYEEIFSEMISFFNWTRGQFL